MERSTYTQLVRSFGAGDGVVVTTRHGARHRGRVERLRVDVKPGVLLGEIVIRTSSRGPVLLDLADVVSVRAG